MEKFNIRITGYGSEVTIGHLTEDVIEIVREKYNDGESLNSIINDEEIVGVHWSEIDDVFHNFNANEDYHLEIINTSNNEVIYDISSEELKSNDENIVYDDFEEIYSPLIKQDLVICCVTGEKGILFEGEFESESFDLSKLKIISMMDVQINDYYHGNMVHKILYNDEIISNEGGDTVGKSFNIYINT